jgi:hypothetical protein
MDPRPLLEALVEEEVDFVLIGGLAAAIMGTTRVTRDIDIAYATFAENLERLCEVLNRFEPRIKVLGKPTGGVVTLLPVFLRHTRIVQLVTSVGEIDILDRIAGFRTYGQIAKHAQTIDLGFPVRVLGIEGLIRAKRAMKRPKDLHDIVELEALADAAPGASDPRQPADVDVVPGAPPKSGRTHIMYIECKAENLNGPAWIGRVTFSKRGNTIYYKDKAFKSLKGGYKANYYDVETFEEYWISGPKRDGSDRLYVSRVPVVIDEDVREEYWSTIRGQAAPKAR